MASDELQRVGEILIEEGAVLAEDIARAGDEKQTSLILSALVGAGAPSRLDLARFLAATYQIPHVSLSGVNIPPDVLNCVPRELIERHEIIPVEKAAGIVFIAKANFFNRAAVSDVRKATGFRVKIVVAPEYEIQDALKRLYGVTAGEGVQVAAPVADLPPEIARSTGGTKKYTAPPGRTAALAPTDRIAMLFTEDWTPARRNGNAPTQPLRAIPISKEDFSLAERSLHIDHIRQWERYYAGPDPLPAIKMSK
ncbi:MAG: hypothetical protein HYY18_23425 [Planctomycetes bacterium]|nr:hypothetical protein [Planctomycetota bacterium]